MAIARCAPFLLTLVATAALAQAPAPVPSPGTPHVLGLTGAPNFRDIGGYPTADGHHVRADLVYRSNKLSALTPADEATVDRLHLVAEIDLRTGEERRSEPSRWLHTPADLYVSPKASLAPTLGPLLKQIHDADSAHRALTSFYAQMPDLYRPEYAAFFHRLAAGDTPMVVHCTAGKDRTGVAAAVLLSALGVSRSVVVGDYTFTNKLLPPPPNVKTLPKNAPKALAALYALPPDARAAVWRADPAYIEAALDAIDREYGSTDGYLRKGLGLSDAEVASLRTRLTE
jgi:protein-tyrosine phosphatase